MSKSPFNVFSDRRPEVTSRPELNELILHLHNKKARPLDVEQYLAGLSEDSRVLAKEIIDTYRGDRDFKVYAAALETATRNTERDYPDTEPDD